MKEVDNTQDILSETQPMETGADMMQLTVRDNRSELVALESLRQAVEGYSGKVLIRLPKSLHKRLTEAARIEGVSLNQYILYKLSQG